MRYLYPAEEFSALIFIAVGAPHFTHEGIQHAADLECPWPVCLFSGRV